MSMLKHKRVLVTGATGFLGNAVCRVLNERGSIPLSLISKYQDLRNPMTEASMEYLKICEVVIHLAAKCGGIGANMAKPAEFIRDNLLMGLNIIDAAHQARAKLVLVGSVCAYPEHNDGPIRESDLWNGYPEPTNAPYGIAKRTLGEVLKAYHKQYGMPCAYVIPANLYGPGDNFNPETSHVIPAMIRKFVDASEKGIDQVSCWGTGTPTRDFLYVDDAAEAIVRAAESIESPDPINVGTGREISTKALAGKISDICNFNGSIRWDKTRPDGQPRRVLDTSRQKERLEFMPSVALEEGLRRTVEWYRENRVGVLDYRCREVIHVPESEVTDNMTRTE